MTNLLIFHYTYRLHAKGGVGLYVISRCDAVAREPAGERASDGGSIGSKPRVPTELRGTVISYRWV